MKQERKTMTLNLPLDEMDILKALADTGGMSKNDTVRRAIRILNIIDGRLRRGESLFLGTELGPKAEVLI
jgi:hypothetical protein